jgi:O-antigen/teichoic acid export membrane protein
MSANLHDIEPTPTFPGAIVPTIGRRNVAAGILGYGWTSALQLLATPVLLALLGPESFGLVGFYMAAQGVSQIFDLGLSPTINREMARASVERRPEEARDFLHTIERGYWLVGILVGLLIIAFAPALTSHWVSTSGLTEAALQRDVRLIALLIVVQWPLTLYEGGLTGLQRMSTLHLVGIVMRTAGVATGLILLYFGRRDLAVYLLALAAGSLIHVLVLARLLRRSLPSATRPARWDPATVYGVWRFAAGMSVLLLLSAVLTHTDRLLLSRLLPLRGFGYYTLASLMSSGLYVLSLPVFYGLFPVLSGQVVAGDGRGERGVYHLGAQSLAVLVIPAAAVIALFAPDILTVWTGSVETAHQTAQVARLLVVGTALNTLMSAPYALQLAHGETRLGILLHIGLILLFVPAIIIAASLYGAIGAGWVWIGLNTVYLAIGLPWTHRLLLRGESTIWLIEDVLAPGAAGGVVVAVGWLLCRPSDSPVLAVASALVTLAAGWFAAAMAGARVRRWLLPSAALWRARRANAHS